MNPKDFGWKEDQQVVVKNPTNKAFTFMVHSKSYTVEAGAKAKMPGYIAWVYVNSLATKIAQETNVQTDKDGRRTDDWQHWNEEGFRKKYYEKLVESIDDVVQTVVEEPELVEAMPSNPITPMRRRRTSVPPTEE